MVNSNNWYSYFSTSGTVTQSGNNPDVQIQISTSSASASTTVNSLYAAERIHDNAAFTLTFQHKFTSSGAASGNSVVIFFGSTTTNPLASTASNQVCVEFNSNTSGGGVQGIHLWKNGTKVVNNTDPSWFGTSNTWITYKISYKRGRTNTWTISANNTVMYTYSDTSCQSWIETSGSYWGLASGVSSSASYNNFIKGVALTSSAPVSSAVLRSKIYERPEACFVNKLATSSQSACAVAYSSRLLKADYKGPMVCVRRSTDNAESDFYGDVEGSLGTLLYGKGTSLTSWLGGATGYLKTWYDQSGNERHISQTTTASQPVIAQGSSGVTITFDGSNDYFELTSNVPLTAGATKFTFVTTIVPATVNWGSGLFAQGDASAGGKMAGMIFFDNNSYTYRGYAGGYDGNKNVYCTANVRRKIVMINDLTSSNTVKINDNGTLYVTSVTNRASSSIATTRFRIGHDADSLSGAYYYNGQINELMIFSSLLTSDESMLYCTPPKVNTVQLGQEPVVRLAGIQRDHNEMPLDYTIGIDTQLLQGTTQNTSLSVWGTSSQGTSGNRPIYYSFDDVNTRRHPFVRFNFTSQQHLACGSRTFSMSPGFTIVAYVKFLTTNDWNRIVDFGNGTPSDNIVFARYSSTSQLTMYLANGGNWVGTINSSDGAISNGEWAVFAGRYTASSRLMELFKNGTQLATATASATLNSRTLSNTYIGRSAYTGGSDWGSMDLAGLYMYDRNLSDTEIASVSNHLMHGWSNSIPRSVPNYSQVKRRGSVTYPYIAPPGTSGGQQEVGMYFPKTVADANCWIEVTDMPSVPLSYCYWFKAEVDGDVTGLHDYLKGGNGGIAHNFYNNAQYFYWNDTNNWTLYSTQASTYNTWYHFAITIDSSFLITTYVNNSIVATAQANSGLVRRSMLYLGNGNGNNPFKGSIFDLRVYDYVLRAYDVTRIYYRGSSMDRPSIMDIASPSNYLVNGLNWSTTMTLTRHSGSFTVESVTSNDYVFTQYRLTNGSTCTNSFSNQTRIQDNESFTFTFNLYGTGSYQGNVNFFCGSTSIPTTTTGSNGGYMVNFQCQDGTFPSSNYYISLVDNSGTRVATATISDWVNDVWTSIVITYKRGTVGTWTINFQNKDIITYNDTNNASWLTTAGAYWGIVGMSYGASGLSSFIRNLELTYTPYSVSNNTIKTLAIVSSKFPPGPLTSNATVLNGNGDASGVYTATASSKSGMGNDAFYAFDNNINTTWISSTVYNATTGAYTGSVSTTADGVAYSGEWLQIQLPIGVVLNSYEVTPDQSSYANRSPRNFVILGSVDGSTWSLVNQQTSITWTQNAQTFTTTSTLSYNYYRLVAQALGNSSSANTTSDRCSFSWSLNSTNIPKRKFVTSSTLSTQVYPPTVMTAASTAISSTSVSYGAGTYVASASTEWSDGNYPPWKAFGSTNADWASLDTYNPSTGAYTGSVSTTAGGVGYTGEWLQIQLPQRIVLHSFEIEASRLYGNGVQIYKAPQIFYILGSNDGTTWTLVHSESNASTYTTPLRWAITTNPIAYSYYRIVVNKCNGGGSGVLQAEIGSWRLYSLQDTTVANRSTGLLPGLTWKYFDSYFNDTVGSTSIFSTGTYRAIGRANICTTDHNISSLSNGWIQNTQNTYSVETFGYFRATVSGDYTFYTNSDDASYLWIGSTALAGYTTANASVSNGGIHGGQDRSGTVKLVAGEYYPIRIMYGQNVSGQAFSFSFTPPSGTRTYDGTGYYFSSNGQDAAFPAESAKVIKDLTKTNTDGVYYINCNGVSTPTYCLMNSKYDGGGWMMLMKATRGTTFNYSASYWTAANTLNADQINRTDGDAKYDVFNYVPVKDVMAIWPDIDPKAYTNVNGNNGGSFYVDDGWVWKQNNWNGSTRTTALAGFQSSRDALPWYPSGFAGYSSSIWAYQGTFLVSGYQRYIFNGQGQAYGGAANSAMVRWGFHMNNESNNTSCDCIGGIGLYFSGTGGTSSYSAGDYQTAYGSPTGGLNRSMRFELFGR